MTFEWENGERLRVEDLDVLDVLSLRAFDLSSNRAWLESFAGRREFASFRGRQKGRNPARVPYIAVIKGSLFTAARERAEHMVPFGLAKPVGDHLEFHVGFLLQAHRYWIHARWLPAFSGREPSGAAKTFCDQIEARFPHYRRPASRTAIQTAANALGERVGAVHPSTADVNHVRRWLRKKGVVAEVDVDAVLAVIADLDFDPNGPQAYYFDVRSSTIRIDHQAVADRITLNEGKPSEIREDANAAAEVADSEEIAETVELAGLVVEQLREWELKGGRYKAAVLHLRGHSQREAAGMVGVSEREVREGARIIRLDLERRYPSADGSA